MAAHLALLVLRSVAGRQVRHDTPAFSEPPFVGRLPACNVNLLRFLHIRNYNILAAALAEYCRDLAAYKPAVFAVTSRCSSHAAPVNMGTGENYADAEEGAFPNTTIAGRCVCNARVTAQ